MVQCSAPFSLDPGRGKRTHHTFPSNLVVRVASIRSGKPVATIGLAVTRAAVTTRATGVGVIHEHRAISLGDFCGFRREMTCANAEKIFTHLLSPPPYPPGALYMSAIARA